MIFNIFLLSLAAMIWGAGFIGTKWTFESYGPYWSNAIRFVVSTVFIIPFLVKDFKKINFQFLKWPFICSLFLCFSMITQTIGLELTTAAKSGFITTFYAFFTPIILMLFRGLKYQWTFWPLLLLSLIGIAFLCNLSFEGFNEGDAWTLACALGFSFHILSVGKIANDYNAITLNGLQSIFVAIISVILAFFFEGIPNLAPVFEFDRILEPSPILGFVILGIFSSNIAFSIQAYAQRLIPAHIVGLVFLLESVFATFFGYLFLNERLTTISLIGCGLVLLSLSLVPKFGRIKRES